MKCLVIQSVKSFEKKVMVSGKVCDVEFWSWYNLALI